MPFYGGLSPYPERSGGRRPTIGVVLDSLLAQMGTAIDGSEGTVAWAYANADARVLGEVYGTHERLGNQWDPYRMTDMLPRWEKILRTNPLPSDTLTARRARVAAAMARLGGAPTYQAVVDTLTVALGSIPFTIEHTASSAANMWTPGSWPFGQHPSGPSVPSNMTQFLQVYPTWFSSADDISIVVSKPANMGNSEFYQRLGAINTALDPVMPAWVTWHWLRRDIHPGAGFFLDEPNLDQEAFDV